MTLSELAQLLAIVGSIVGILGVGWKISRAISQLIDKVTTLTATTRRIELRMRGIYRRLESLEADRKENSREW